MVEVLDRGLGEMDKRRQQLGELLAQRQREIEVWTEQVGDLEREAALQRARAAELAETLVVAQDQVEKIRGELLAAEREIDALEGSQAALREKADAAHDDLSGHEVKLAESRQRATFVAEDVLREFQADVATLDWKAILWRAEDEPEGMKSLDLDEEEEAGESAPAEAAPKPRRRKEKTRGEPTEADLAALEATNWDELKGEVDALRQRLTGMGAVNLVAIEEYAELKQRHDFLRAQSGDLAGAKAELIKAIDEINQTSQQQFAVAFEQIKKNFEYTFQTLFGGGRATLDVVESEDIMEGGIEIVAQPPGTRLKGITLLSGGQKALTAVALLFALYMVKPSPFCLLDELDAPLDESNIGRFTDLLQKFIHDSQFIIITHNKRTVAAASAIYGVTMEERGVSKTVSMRFNHDRGETEAHPRNLAEAVTGAQAAIPGRGLMKYILVDGFNLVYRCFFAIPELTRADGFPTNALHGWVKSLWKIADQERPYSMAVFFDLGGSEDRLALHPEYKAQREEMPEALVKQLPHVKTLTQAMGLGGIESHGVESDDLLASEAVGLARAGHEVIIVSSDKDFAQIVGERITMMLPPPTANPKLGWRRLDAAGVVEKFGVPPAQMADYLALVGDTSDNIRGIDGVGPKTAAKWLAQFRNVEEVIARRRTAARAFSRDRRGGRGAPAAQPEARHAQPGAADGVRREAGAQSPCFAQDPRGDGNEIHPDRGPHPLHPGRALLMSADRQTDLENRFAWLERHVAEQDKAMLEMGEELRRLRRRVEVLQERQQAATPTEKPDDDSEKPPHY